MVHKLCMCFSSIVHRNEAPFLRIFRQQPESSIIGRERSANSRPHLMRRRACAGARRQQLGSARCTGLCRTPRAAAQLAAHHGARAAKAECRRKWLSALSSWHRGLLLPRITQRSSGRRSSREAGARPRALSFAGTALPAARASRAQEHGPTPRLRAENGACFTAFRGAIGPCPTHRGPEPRPGQRP